MIRYLLIASLLIASTTALAQDKPKGVEEFNEFNAKPLEGWVWDEDERLQDLVEQLQQKELTLQEIDGKIARATGKKASSKMAENMAWRSTQRMDLNGGGPVRWDAFYGRNAENFFYHPKDPNTSYHTNTVLQQVAPTAAGGVPGNQGVPAHQRPPQFDYIYRGYEKAQARAREEARELVDKIEDMKSRRRQLEGEVVVLWMKLAFRVIDRDKLPENPALRFAFIAKVSGQANADEQALALTSAARFLATAMLFNETLAERDPRKAFVSVSEIVGRNRKGFEDGFLKLTALRKDASSDKTTLGQFKFLSRKLEDTSKLLSEGYKGWQDGDANDDEPTKFDGLKRIQDGVVRYSKILLALNELVGQMEKEWAVDLSTGSTEFSPRWDVTYVPPIPSPIPHPAPQSALQSSDPVVLGLDWLIRHQMADGSWSFDHAKCAACNGQCRNSTSNASGDPSAATGLTLLAFYDHGESHEKGDHQDSLRRGIDYLKRRAEQGNGRCYGTNANLYSQGIASMALAKCYALTKDPAFKAAAQSALDFIQQSQDPKGGGWRYTPLQAGDTSATGWQVSALMIGRGAGLKVNQSVVVNAHHFLDRMQVDGGSGYGYLDTTRSTPTLSAVGLYCRLQMGGFGWVRNRPAVTRGIDGLLKTPPNENLYWGYYAVRVFDLAEAKNREAWKQAMKSLLVNGQAQQGHERGSWWDGFDKNHMASVGGRLITTALATTILQACGE
jgi:hypothetical protein